MVSYGIGRTAFADLGIAKWTEMCHVYLAAVVEIKRYRRLPDSAFHELLGIYSRGGGFELRWSSTDPDKLTFTTLGSAVRPEPVSAALHSALTFVVEAVSYAWAAEVRYGIATNSLAWVPARLATTNQGLPLILFGAPSGALRDGSLIAPSLNKPDQPPPLKKAKANRVFYPRPLPPSSADAATASNPEQSSDHGAPKNDGLRSGQRGLGLFGFLLLCALGALTNKRCGSVEYDYRGDAGTGGIAPPLGRLEGWRRGPARTRRG